MHLILNHVAEFQEVGDTYRSGLVKLLSGLTVIEVSRAKTWQTCLVSPFLQIFKMGSIEDRSSKFHAETLTCSTENGLENLAEVHS